MSELDIRSENIASHEDVVISVKGLKYQYPGTEKLALDDINFEIKKGEFFGIVGENGAGKSTLSQAFLGLVPQFYKGGYGGQVIVDSMDTASTKTADLCKSVGLVFQNPFNQLSGAKDTVYDEVGFGLQNLGMDKEEIKSRIEAALSQMDIAEYRDRNPFDLSGGQMQRVAIASVLAMNPKILVFDEPTSQLDPEGAENVFHIVEELTKTGITIIMIEQKLEKLAAYCDRCLLLCEGHQIALDTPRAIFSRPDLTNYRVNPPAFTAFAKSQLIAYPDGTYPVTMDETIALIKEEPYVKRIETFKEAARAAAVGETFAEECPAGLTRSNPLLDMGDDEVSNIKPHTSDELFHVQDLHFSYIKGKEVFSGVNLDLDMRPTAIIGQNGAGKTTLVRILKGLLKPDSGHILFRGEDLATKTVAELAGKVGYVFQNPDDQIFKYCVLDEVMFGPLNIGMDQQTAEKKAREALETVGFTHDVSVNPYDLDLSERKMVAIASVLAMDTDVIILDEPTIAQDCHGREKLQEIIKSLKDHGKLVIAILHDMDFVAQSFERVVVMTHGQILKDGTPAEVFSDEAVLTAAKLTKPHLLELSDRL